LKALNLRLEVPQYNKSSTRFSVMTDLTQLYLLAASK
jgi:hypothetical protein